MQQPDDHYQRSDRLTRDLDHKILGGVCAGIAKHYGYDTTVVRVVTALLTLVWGAGLLVYAVLWMVMPVEEHNSTMTSGVLGEGSSDPSSTPPSPPQFANDDLADRARRAAEEFAVAARSAAETARIAAEQFAEVAKAAASAGREAWDQQQQQRAAATRNESASNVTSMNGDSQPSGVPGSPPPPPMTPPPPSQQQPLPHEDVHPE